MSGGSGSDSTVCGCGGEAPADRILLSAALGAVTRGSASYELTSSLHVDMNWRYMRCPCCTSRQRS